MNHKPISKGLDKATGGDTPPRNGAVRPDDGASIIHDTTDLPKSTAGLPKSLRRRKVVKGVAHGVSWGVAVPMLAFLVFYLILLVRPIPLPFVGNQARAMVLESLPDNMELELGETFLSLENGVSPALRFSPVVLLDRATGGKVEMEALEIGFSAGRALLGQPGAEITLVGPRLQVVQDLFGPRLAQFELIEETNDEHALVRVIEGESAFPTVGIQNRVSVQENVLGSPALSLRSDNDWLVFNLLAGEEGLSSIVQNAQDGLFSSFSIRGGSLEMHDSVYGLVRSFDNIGLEIISEKGKPTVQGRISAEIAGKRMQGTILRTVNSEGNARLVSEMTNLDFSAFVPFMDDPDAQVALHGTGGVIIDVEYTGQGNTGIKGGTFLIDLNGTSLRILDDEYPVTASPMEIVWEAEKATFDIKSTRFQAGDSYADFSGAIAMGLDQNFGPTMRISTQLKNIYLHPLDLGPPEKPIEELQFLGWSAPLYGALGIDHLVAASDDFKMVISGRMDMLQSGMGVNMDVAIEGATADDLKRIWPYVIGGDSRDWFVKNIEQGKVVTSAMKFRFPVGSIGKPGEDVPVPDGAINVEMLAEGVELRVSDALELAQIPDLAHLKIENGEIKIGFGAAQLPTEGGALQLLNSAFSIGWDEDDTAQFRFDGNIKAPISALLAIQRATSPNALDGLDLPVNPTALNGEIDTLFSTRVSLLGDDYEVQDLQYSLEGKVADFSSSEPISTYSLDEGQFSFVVNENAYQVNGPVKLNGLTTTLALDGSMADDATPNIKVSATFSADDFKEFGFDVSEYMGGRVRFSAEPQPDDTLKISVDLKDASVSVPDIGLSKSRGTAGSLLASVKFEEPMIDISGIDLRFGHVRLRGDLEYHEQDGLVSADFSQFAVQQGDNAQIRLTPRRDGYGVRLRGQQLDLKPLMRRFFSLEGGGTGGPQAAGLEETIVLDVGIERALGFYSTTAFNLNADLTLQGNELREISLQSQFGGSNSLSIATNPVPGGQAMSMAFGDLGTLLRFVGIYPRLAGGSGSLVMTSNTAQNISIGEFELRNFALIDEANVVQVLGNHPDSRSLIERQNRVDFNSGRAKFVRRSDRIEIIDAVLDGGTQGGTARGFIYTDAGQYDLVGTYIPLFGLNNAFQQIPILGPLLGGREGEGLFGVTFAVRGPLANPQFSVNPLSLLVPGAFRSLFEFREQTGR